MCTVHLASDTLTCHGCGLAGDRLHFGIAAEQAKAEGISVETVFVADDVAVDTGKITGRRGIAGTVFVHKVAGAAAAAGLSLEEVAAEARAAAAAVRSIGIATSVCTVPGQAKSSRLDGAVIEIGAATMGRGALAVDQTHLQRCVGAAQDWASMASQGRRVPSPCLPTSWLT